MRLLALLGWKRNNADDQSFLLEASGRPTFTCMRAAPMRVRLTNVKIASR